MTGFYKKSTNNKNSYKQYEKKEFNYTDKQLTRYGLNKLSQRDYTRSALKLKMLRLQKDETIVTTVLDYLERNGYLSDKRKASSILNQYANKEGLNKTRIRLKQKGVPDILITEMIENIKEDRDDEAIATNVVVKKYKVYNPEEYMKYSRFLLSRGFNFDVIKKALEKFKNNE